MIRSLCHSDPSSEVLVRVKDCIKHYAQHRVSVEQILVVVAVCAMGLGVCCSLDTEHLLCPGYSRHSEESDVGLLPLRNLSFSQGRLNYT